MTENKSSKSLETGKNLEVDKNHVLIGPFGKTLDLRNVELDVDIVINDGKEFARAIKNGRPPQSPIYISGNAEVEVLYIPLQRAMVDYAVIENLPNLRELHISGENSIGVKFGDLKWLICQNLPKLKKITAKGRLFWLQINDAPMLETIDTKACPNLDNFSIHGAPKLSKINVSGCKKLQRIDGLTNDTQIALDVREQISVNQEKSKGDGTIYKNMTYSDVLMVLDRINEGLKLALKRNYLRGEIEAVVLAGSGGDMPYHFGFKLLRPLEAVTTGGTGESYAYRTILDGCEMGNSTQEDCLEYILKNISAIFEFEVPGETCSSTKEILTLLNKLVKDAANPNVESKPKKEKKINFDKLDGMAMCELLSVSPHLILECDLKKLTPYQWTYLLIDQPQLAASCNFKKLNGQNLSSLLCRQPQLALKCDFTKLNNRNWVTLLDEQPQFVDKCDLSKFTSDDWSDLLSTRPEFAERCDFNLLNGSSWGSLLAKQPKFSDKCDFTKLKGPDWARLLAYQPQFSNGCDFGLLAANDWAVLNAEQPHFKAQYDAQH